MPEGAGAAAPDGPRAGEGVTTLDSPRAGEGVTTLDGPRAGEGAAPPGASALAPAGDEAGGTAEPPSPAEPPRPRRALAFAGFALAALVGGSALAFEIDEASSRGQVARGVVLGEAKLGGLEGPALEAELERFAAAFAARRLVLRAGSHAAETTAAEAGVALDVPATAEAARRAGREGAWPARWASWLTSFARPRGLVPLARLDEAAGEATFDALDRAMPERPFAGAVRAPGGSAQAEYPRPGSLVDRPAARALLLARLPLGDASLTLPLQARPAPLPREAVDEALARARRALAGPLALASDDGSRRVEWSPAELGAALESRPAEGGAPRLELTFSAEALEAKLGPLRPSLDEAPADARFEIAGDRVSVVPSRPGRRLDTALAAEALLRAAEAEKREGPLPYGPGDAPALSTEGAEALRITKLVASFTTRHGCCEPRVQNIHRIADLVDGALVRPGETFSVNERVGPRTAERGFVFAPSIAEHETVETIGGGVSQFATTLFNALIDGGYEIVERQPHSFYFSRYPKGHEATLSFPKPDLIFRNDTDAGVLIKVDYGKDYVRVRLFGDNGGRKVERKASSDFDFRDPPVEYEPNAGVSPDDEKVVAHGTRGWSVLVSRVITYPDGTSKEEKRKVTYLPRPRRIDVHPCRLPKGARGYTGKPCPKPEEPPPVEPGMVEASAPPPGETH
ncbi:MAG TPA: VanW family protein [Polyangiaceae bacterium]|nr:VanW family protein [Polyangiaceae bacterium]